MTLWSLDDLLAMLQILSDCHILQNIEVELLTHFSFSSGAAGLVVGGFGGLAFSHTPVLFATVSGLQWFGVGSTFWCMSTSELICPSHAETP